MPGAGAKAVRTIFVGATAVKPLSLREIAALTRNERLGITVLMSAGTEKAFIGTF